MVDCSELIDARYGFRVARGKETGFLGGSGQSKMEERGNGVSSYRRTLR
jgi:hypothetical protein